MFRIANYNNSYVFKKFVIPKCLLVKNLISAKFTLLYTLNTSIKIAALNCHTTIAVYTRLLNDINFFNAGVHKINILWLTSAKRWPALPHTSNAGSRLTANQSKSLIASVGSHKLFGALFNSDHSVINL